MAHLPFAVFNADKLLNKSLLVKSHLSALKTKEFVLNIIYMRSKSNSEISMVNFIKDSKKKACNTF